VHLAAVVELVRAGLRTGGKIRTIPEADDDLVDDVVLLPDAAVVSESLAKFPVPIAAIPMESLIPDERVVGFCPPLS
jgi:hypothetical protein